MIIIIEKDLTSSCNKKNTRLIFENVTKKSRFKNPARRLIFENVTKKSRFKNPARRINTFPFLLQSLYTIIISIIWNLFC